MSETVTWTVHSGGLYGDAVDHAALEEALRETKAVALVREESPDALGVVLAVTGRTRRVAVVEGGEVVPGPPLFRFVDDLAAASGTEVAVGDVWAGGEVYVDDLDELEADGEDLGAEGTGIGPAGDVAGTDLADETDTDRTDTDETPDAGPDEAQPGAEPVTRRGRRGRRRAADDDAEHVRVAAVTAMPLREVPFWTEDLGVPVAVLDRGDRRLVLAERPLGVGGWGRHALPVVELDVQDGEPSVVVTRPAPAQPRTWRWVPGWRPLGLVGDADGKAAATFAEDVLGAGGMATALADALPDLDRTAVRDALLDRTDGLSRLARALGLPQEADDVLHGRLTPLAVPGARVYEPRGIAHAIGETVALETRGYGAVPAFWRTYRGIAVDRPWVMRGATATEALIGAAALTTALRSAGRTRRVGAAVGAWMLVDAAAELAAARWVSRHTTPEGRFLPPGGPGRQDG
ncbi:hypothetical protein V5H98_17085 [Georgenia sp. M64]|uniref:hypothetical protein n=1 Tax=Georgenia sp. M64 TaxID=3120520 RepID=UPI0030E5752A